MATSNHNLRPRDRVDYTALHEGTADPNSPDDDVFHDSFLEVVTASSPTRADRSADAWQLLANQLSAAQAEQQMLRTEAELRAMREELALIQAENQRLKSHVKAPLKSTENGGVPTADQLRSLPDVQTHVLQELGKLGIQSSDDSSFNEDDDLISRNEKKRTKEGKKSGKLSKVTNCIVNPQLWPQSELSLSYVSKDIKYDDLTLPEFVAGYSSILTLSSLPDQERQARLAHLMALMYLAVQFPWSIVRDFHAAVLFEIERGRAKWGDSFYHLENRFLHRSYAGKSGSSGSSASPTAQGTFYCKDWQTGKCQHKNDHYRLLRNERKWVKHICGKYFRTGQTVARHLGSDSPLVSPSED